MKEDGIIIVVTIDPTLAGIGEALRSVEIINDDREFDALVDLLNMLPSMQPLN